MGDTTIADRVGQRLTERGEWRAGIKVWHGDTWFRVADVSASGDLLAAFARAWVPGAECTPDLTDWPTLGVLIGIIVEQTGGVTLNHGVGRAMPMSGKAGCAWRLKASGMTNGEAIGALYLAVTEADHG